MKKSFQYLQITTFIDVVCCERVGLFCITSAMKIYIREVLSTLVLVAQMGASNQYIPTEVFFEIFNYLGQKREIFLYCTFLRL